ncbi:MAG: hypothetical protein KGZ42_05790 [Melioribacter sp.]|nr:hypothetical protein [Melioribacter sp.]
MILTLVVSDNCEACDRAKIVIEEIRKKHPCLIIETININQYINRKLSITPALLIDHKLFSYGDINQNRLLNKINKE